MLKTALLDIKGEKKKDIILKEDIWGIEPNDAVVYDAIVLAKASLTQGTHKVKNRSEVSGGGRKPWRQKGTGRARQGSIRSPQWRGGGVVFGPQLHSFNKKMNKKEKRLALKSVLSYKILDKELIILDSLVINEPKTKYLLEILENLKIDKSALIVVKELTDNLILVARNISNIKLIKADELNTLDVITYKYLIITEEAKKTIEEVLL